MFDTQRVQCLVAETTRITEAMTTIAEQQDATFWSTARMTTLAWKQCCMVSWLLRTSSSLSLPHCQAVSLNISSTKTHNTNLASLTRATHRGVCT